MQHLTMTRDEFEEWLSEHSEEIWDRLDHTPRSLAGWTKRFTKAVADYAAEHTDDDIDADGAFGGGDVSDDFEDEFGL